MGFLKNGAAKIYIVVCALALSIAVALSGCGGVNIAKEVAGTWNLETMAVGSQSIGVSEMGISIEAKEDGTAVLINKGAGTTVDYTWEADKSKSSNSDTVYVMFKTGDLSLETTIRPSESTMTIFFGAGVENTYRKAS